MMNGRESQRDLWMEFREKTGQSAPARLAGMVRARLPRVPGVLPEAAAACLVSSVLLTAAATFVLTAPSPSRPDHPVDPPPVFGDLQDGLFPRTVKRDFP